MRSSASTEVEYSTHNSLRSICPLSYSLLSPSLTTHSLSSISLPDPSSSIAGIPRPVPNHETEVQAILSVPCVAAVTPAYEHETEFSVQVAQYWSYHSLSINTDTVHPPIWHLLSDTSYLSWEKESSTLSNTKYLLSKIISNTLLNHKHPLPCPIPLSLPLSAPLPPLFLLLLLNNRSQVTVFGAIPPLRAWKEHWIMRGSETVREEGVLYGASIIDIWLFIISQTLYRNLTLSLLSFAFYLAFLL